MSHRAADNHEAHERGRDRPDLCWISTDRDAWHRNPFYTGLPEPHPEDEVEDIDAWRANRASPGNVEWDDIEF